MKQDARKIGRAGQYAIRRLAVGRIREGESVKAVSESLGISPKVAYKWLRLQKRGGARALIPKSPTGRPPSLTAQQRQKLKRMIIGRDPRQYGFDFGLWTRKIISSLIKEEFGLDLKLTAVGRLLYSLDITPRQPLRRAYERDPESVRIWKEETFPEIRKLARKLGADIFFSDEAGVRSDVPLGRTWGEKGKRTMLQTSGRRQSINAISFINSAGAFWYDLYSGKFTADLFIEKLKRFMRGRRNPIILIIDGHPTHKARKLKEFIEAQQGKLRVFFLPGYSPDLNPDEYVWGYLKKNGASKAPLRKDEPLKERVDRDLARMKKNKALITSFFMSAEVSYIWD